jgi:gliding motility-associated-like protein
MVSLFYNKSARLISFLLVQIFVCGFLHAQNCNHENKIAFNDALNDTSYRQICEDEGISDQLFGTRIPEANCVYTWQIREDGGQWSELAKGELIMMYNANISDFDFQNSVKELSYRRLATYGLCERSESNELKFTVYKKSEAVISNYIDTLEFIFTIDLDISASVGDMELSLNNNIVDDVDNSDNVRISGLNIGENIIKLNATNGLCISDAKSVTITVKDVKIPNGFSPDGDGINDCFRVQYGENATSATLIVSDRYNNIVYRNEKFNLGSGDLTDCHGWWDGKTSWGDELPAGTYFYQLILNDDKFYKGYVILKR